MRERRCRTASTTLMSRPLSLALAVSLVSVLPVRAQQALLADAFASPAIARLVESVERGDPAGVEAFWRDLERHGAPLVESDPDHPGHSLVTFVYRASDSTTDAALESNLASLDPESEASSVIRLPLRRLAGSDVLALTFRLRNDIRVPYRFHVSRSGHESELVVDPLNPSVWEPEVASLRASVLELPEARPQPWRNAAVVQGDWDEIVLTGPAGVERTVNVYKPAGWQAGRTGAYPALVALGSFGTGIGMRVDRLADYLVVSGALPPMVFLLLDLGPSDEARRYEPTDEFVVDVLLPYARERYGVSPRPEDIAVSGTSRRGLVGSLMAFRRPNAIGNVISLSGSYYWKPADEKAWVWVPAQFARAERSNIRFYVAAGELETFVNPGNHGHYLVGTNRHFRDVLCAKGYDLAYVEFNGVHSELDWQDWLAAGLLHFFGNK